MINIEEFIESIEKRPLMYLDQKKIDYLYYYLVGYLYKENDCNDDVDNWFRHHFENWTLIWVKNNIDIDYKRHSFCWYQIYKDVTKNDDEAIELFFKLCKLFFKEYHNMISNQNP